MSKFLDLKCDECNHKIREHNTQGKCGKFIIVNKRKYICDCKVNMIELRNFDNDF